MPGLGSDCSVTLYRMRVGKAVDSTVERVCDLVNCSEGGQNIALAAVEY